MKNNNTRRFLFVLFLAGALLLAATIGSAAALSHHVTVTLRPGFGISFGGVTVPLPDDQPVLVHEGRSYLPVRLIAELMGLEVNWDGEAGMINVLTGAAPKPMPETIPAKVNIEEWGGANLYDNAGDNPGSRYFVNYDFYRARNDSQLTIIENFKTYQQTSEWSCGPATALMVLWHFGVEDYDEWDISVMMKAHTDLDDPEAEPGSANNFGEYGADVGQMTRFFQDLEDFRVVETSYQPNYSASDLIQQGDPDYTPNDWGNLPPTFSYMSLYTTENDAESEDWADAADSYFIRWLTGHLKAGRPIMVEWVDWDGHWQAIVGYDNNGTPEIGDDMLIFADPYDTSDHWQDGYYVYPLERWFYMWNDRNIAPKPYQLQPYLVVEPIQ